MNRLGAILALCALLAGITAYVAFRPKEEAAPPSLKADPVADAPAPSAASTKGGDALPVRGGDSDPDDPLIGTLDEGKTYRLVDGHPITGKEVAELLVEDLWAKEIRAFRDHILVRESMERMGLSVTEEEIDAELKAKAEAYAREQGADPKMFTLAAMARQLQCSLLYLRETMRDAMGLKKLLVKDGEAKPTERLEDSKVMLAMQKRLETLIRTSGVEEDPTKLRAGEALRIGGRGFSKEEVRAYILGRIGALGKKELLRHLEAITVAGLVERALKEQGKEALTDEDRQFHLSWRAGMIEAEQGVPNGKDALKFQIQQMGLTVEQFMRQRALTIDAGITALARGKIGAQDVQAEYQANTQAYRRSELKLAHILLRVRDAQGNPYTKEWQAPGHDRLNKFVAQERETRFKDARQKIEQWIGAAKSDFAKAANELTEDESNRAEKDGQSPGKGGYLGRIGPETELPALPVDKDLLREALKLKPGELSAPLRSAFGWHLVKCLENQETTFEEAERSVYLALLKRHRQQIYENLSKKAKIEDRF